MADVGCICIRHWFRVDDMKSDTIFGLVDSNLVLATWNLTRNVCYVGSPSLDWHGFCVRFHIGTLIEPLPRTQTLKLLISLVSKTRSCRQGRNANVECWLIFLGWEVCRLTTSIMFQLLRLDGASVWNIHSPRVQNLIRVWLSNQWWEMKPNLDIGEIGLIILKPEYTSYNILLELESH